MRRRCLIVLAFLIAQAALGANWNNGQAARAVIGQTSFSSRDAGLDPIAMSIAGNRLYVAGSNQRVSAYSIDAVLAGNSGVRCGVCFVAPVSVASQAVAPSSSRFAVFQNSVAVADPDNGRVLFWRDTSKPSAAAGPDVVLVDTTNGAHPVSVALDSQYLYVGDPAAHRVLIWKTSLLSAGSIPEAVLGQRSLSLRESLPTGAASVSNPIALVSDGKNLYVADADSHRVLIFSQGESAFNADGVLSTASQISTALSPGGLITIRGAHLADDSDVAIDNGQESMPTNLAGAEVTVDGRAIPLMAASLHEIRAHVPYDIGYASNVSVALRWTSGARAGRSSAATALSVRLAAPAVFSFPGTPDPRKGLLLHTPGKSADGPPGSPVTSEEPAQPGETLVVWAAGLGAVSEAEGIPLIAGRPFDGEAAPVQAEVEALVNGEPVEVLSAVLPHGALGIYEVRIALPRDTPPSPKVTLSLREANAISNTVAFPLGPGIADSTIHN